MTKMKYNDELNLFDILYIIWRGKIKIFLITAFCVIITYFYFLVNKPHLKAVSQIHPITTFEEEQYSKYNSFINYLDKKYSRFNNSFNNQVNDYISLNKFNDIDKKYLLDLFIEEMRSRETIIEAIRKFKLLNENEYSNNSSYLDAVDKLAYSLQIKPPRNVKGNLRGDIKNFWTIEININNSKKWIDALKYINNQANNKVRAYVNKKFDNSIKSNLYEIKFKLEELENQIKNAKNDYKKYLNNRLSFLNEQALIARELNIKNNTLELKTFNIFAIDDSRIETPNFYYMRGYQMIEKEIDLIKSRSYENAFTKDLNQLEKQKRNLVNNNSLNDIKHLFSETPIKNLKNFKAASIIFKDTKFIKKVIIINMLILATIIGMLIGATYVFFDNYLRSKK